MALKSCNFGQTCIPKALKKEKVKENKQALEDQKNQTESQASSLNESNSLKRKEREEDINSNSTSSFRNPLKKMKQMNQQDKKNNMRHKGIIYQKPKELFNHLDNFVQSNRSDLENRTKIPEGLEWLRWNRNSCRYDSFLSVFLLGLFSKYHDFSEEQCDNRQRSSKHYIQLCETAKLISNAKELTAKQEIVWDQGIGKSAFSINS